MKKNSDSLTRFPSISYLLTFFVKLMDMTADDLQRLSDKIQKNKEFESIYEDFEEYLALDDLHQKKMKRFADENDISFEQINKLQLSFFLLITLVFVKNKTASSSILLELTHLADVYCELIKSVQLGDTSEEKLLYILLAYFFIPYLALKMAEYKFSEITFDTGLPGGKFWFLPFDYGSGIQFPIKQVFDWLIQLSGDVSEKEFIEKRISFTEDEKETNLKNFANWKKGKPIKYKKIVDILEKLNTDTFNNSFKADEKNSLEENLSKVFTYIKDNHFSPDLLSYEIPWKEQDIQAILEHPETFSDELKKLFIDRMLERFSKPAKSTIENSFLIASVFQNGFYELKKVLGEKQSSSLVSLFVFIYNNYFKYLKECNDMHPSREGFLKTLTIQTFYYREKGKSWENLYRNLKNHITKISPRGFDIILALPDNLIDIQLSMNMTDEKRKKEKEEFYSGLFEVFKKEAETLKEKRKDKYFEIISSFEKEFSIANYQEVIRISKYIPNPVIFKSRNLIDKLIESYNWYVKDPVPPEVEWYHFDNYTKELLSQSKDRENEDTYKYAAHSRLDFLLCDFRKKLNSERSEIDHLLKEIELFQENRYYEYLLDYKKGQYSLFLRDFQSAENHFKQGLASADRRGGSPQYFILEKLFILARLMGKEDSTLEYSRKLILLGYFRNRNELSAKTEMLKNSDRKIPHIGFFP